MCGVETVTEKCAATFDLSNIDIDPECTNNDLDNRVNFRVFCKSQFRESTINALRAAGCPYEFSDDDSPNRYLAREDGQYCESLDWVNTYTLIKRILQHQHMCSPLHEYTPQPIQHPRLLLQHHVSTTLLAKTIGQVTSSGNIVVSCLLDSVQKGWIPASNTRISDSSALKVPSVLLGLALVLLVVPFTKY